jgi:tetratricopeptide (TPR) repeat protein
VRRAQVHLVEGDAEAALASATRAAALAPGDPHVQLQLGIVHQARARAARLRGEPPPEDVHADAVAAFAAAGDGAPSRALRNRAALEKARTYAWWDGHEAEAARAYRALVEDARSHGERPLQRVAARSAARLARRRDDPEALRWALERMVEADPGVSGWRSLAAVHDTLGGSGEEVLRNLVAGRPSSPLAHITFARYLADAGRLEEAIAHLRRARTDGVHPTALIATEAQLHLEAGDREAGRAAVVELAEHFPGSLGGEIARAHLDLHDGHPAEAVARLRAVLERRESWEARYLLAVAHTQMRQFGLATQAIDRARELAPTWVLPLERLDARIHAQSRRFTEAVLALRRLRRLAGRLDDADRLLLARSLYGEGRRGAGRALLQRLLAEQEPPDPGVVLEYARRERRADPQRAAHLLDGLLERDPGQPAALRMRTELDVAAGRRDEALARLERSLEQAPSRADPTRLLRALVLFEAGDAGVAEREMTALVERETPYPPAVPRLVALYASQGRVDEAIATLRAADRGEGSAAAGRFAVAHRVLRARLHLERGAPGDLQEAESLLESALAQRSDLPGAKNDLAYVLATRERDLDRALQLAQEAQQALDDDPNAADTLGLVYLKKGLHTAAATQFELALDLARDGRRPSALLHYHRGLALAALERPAEARAAFDAALKIDPGFADAGEARRSMGTARRAPRTP